RVSRQHRLTFCTFNILFTDVYHYAFLPVTSRMGKRYPPTSTLLPYTTLFRSICAGLQVLGESFHAGGKLADGLGLLDATTSQLGDRKSARLNSSHVSISYAVVCLANKTCHQSYGRPAEGIVNRELHAIGAFRR